MQTTNPYCSIARDGRGIATLTITRAGPLNILNTPAIEGVREGLELLAQDDALRAVIVRGESERSMIGGADIKEMAKLDQASAETFISNLRDLCEAARACPVPVIARLPGYCLGGGLEFAAACDFRIAAHDAKFAMPEVKVGIPSVIHAALLPRLIGWGRTRWFLMTAATIDAPTALTWGLVDVVATPGELDAEIERALEAVLACGPQAIRAQKALLRRWEELPLKESVDISVKTFGEAYRTDEPARLMGEFVNRKR